MQHLVWNYIGTSPIFWTRHVSESQGSQSQDPSIFTGICQSCQGQLGRAEKNTAKASLLPNAFDWQPHLFKESLEPDSYCQCCICVRAPERRHLTVTATAKKKEVAAEQRQEQEDIRLQEEYL